MQETGYKNLDCCRLDYGGNIFMESRRLGSTSSKTLVTTYDTTGCHNPDNQSQYKFSLS